MPRRRIPVRKIKEALRLKFTCGLTDRQVARSIGVARSTAPRRSPELTRLRSPELTHP